MKSILVFSQCLLLLEYMFLCLTPPGWVRCYRNKISFGLRVISNTHALTPVFSHYWRKLEYSHEKPCPRYSGICSVKPIGCSYSFTSMSISTLCQPFINNVLINPYKNPYLQMEKWVQKLFVFCILSKHTQQRSGIPRSQFMFSGTTVLRYHCSLWYP